MIISGIYKITSPSNKIYIGSSKDISQRISQHKQHLNKHSHPNQKLQRAWIKYEGNLKFETILICELKDLIFYEQLIIDNFKPEYNIAKIAGSNLGVKQSKETIEKRVAKLRGKKRSPDICQKFSQIKLGKSLHLSEESVEKRRIISTGRRHTQETKDKIRDLKLGKKFPKLSEAKKGFKFSDESRLKMRLARLGKKYPKTNESIIVL